ncbi:hypothetical protein BD413DRAFT_234933 [Trametes elegans]|nr:hypothetical protein BD413DRAFT_234933 [Trametes elegans]
MSATGDNLQFAACAALGAACVLYGGELALYSSTVRLAFDERRQRTKMDIFFLLFGTVLFCLSTAFVAVMVAFGGEIWIARPEHLGGAIPRLDASASVWYLTSAGAAIRAAVILSSGLLIYRCWVIWNDFRIFALLIALYLGTSSTSIALLSVSSLPPTADRIALVERLAVVEICGAVIVNLLSTALIWSRLHSLGKGHGGLALGTAAARQYTDATAVFVESALPYTVAGVAYAVAFAIRSPALPIFLMVYGLMSSISSQLIIFRVLSGGAWTRDRSLMRCGDEIESARATKYSAIKLRMMRRVRF